MAGIIFILGILIGSFLNVCIYRIPKKESIAFPPSHCTNCNTKLKPFDLVPVFSYLFLGGKCRYCHNKISIRYPLIELLTGMIFLFLFLKFHVTYLLVLYLFLASILIVIAFIDFDHQIIPTELVILGLLAGIITIFIQQPVRLSDSFFGFLIGGGFFLLIALLSNGGMGGGDIKLMAMLGIWFGMKGILLIIFLSFVIGAIYSIPLLILKKSNRKKEIPFGPFIVIATFITIFYYKDIISYYCNVIVSF